MSKKTLKDVVNQSSKSVNSESAGSRLISGCEPKALPAPSSTPEDASEYFLVRPGTVNPLIANHLLKHAQFVNIGDDIFYRIPVSDMKVLQSVQDFRVHTSRPEAESVPAFEQPHFSNPYLKKGMLTPNPEWERKVWSGEVDRYYKVKTGVLVAKLPPLLINSSYAFTRPHYFINLYCLRVAMALRLRILGSKDRVLKEFAHASLYRDEWRDLNCPGASNCDECSHRDDCADIFWNDC